VFCYLHVIEDLNGLHPSEYGHSTVSLLCNTAVPVLLHTLGYNTIEFLLGDLFDIGLGFVQAQNVGLGLIQELMEGLLFYVGVNPVYIP